jgi:hypothetical protein
LGLNIQEELEGIIEITSTMTVSPNGNNMGVQNSNSVGRSMSLVTSGKKLETSFSGQPNQIKCTIHRLAPGYVEAETLCKDVFEELTNLSLDIFSKLTTSGFTNIA